MQVCVALILCVTALDAGDGPDAIPREKNIPQTVAISLDGHEPIVPCIHPSMPAAIKTKLERAHKLAIERISEMPKCKNLFTALGADAVETLKTGLYFPAGPAKETSLCRRAIAQSYVGGAPTWICQFR